MVPWLLAQSPVRGSRELFTLSRARHRARHRATAPAAVFGVSFALGAFLAGVVVRESDDEPPGGADVLPLRDAFAVLFFVSVGMLFDPRSLCDPLAGARGARRS